MKPIWYVRRLRKMDRAELAERARHAMVRRTWREQWVRPGQSDPLALGQRAEERRPPALLPAGWADGVAPDSIALVRKAADAVLEGRWELFGTERTDLVAPDWMRDHVSGRSAPRQAYCFDVPYRDEAAIGNVKTIWELSRHHHLTVLAAAYAVTGDERYAERVGAHLRSWWDANPFLNSVHWTSGIELGIRLISWVWCRRLLDGWSGAPELFERNDVCARQVARHVQWLRTFTSGGSSANNHVIAEAAGIVVAAAGFPWFPEAAQWAAEGRDLLARELDTQTFPSGLNRELASEYHGLVLELGLAAAIEAGHGPAPLSAATWAVLGRMADALATVVDARERAPRQGDADDGFGLVLDAPHANRWHSLLGTGTALFGRLPWWPPPENGVLAAAPDVRTAALTALVPGAPLAVGERPPRRAWLDREAGMALLRTRTAAGHEVWVRADSGPHGFLSIAAHAHADALAIEVRHDGVDVIADPGTYCYHGEPQWRSYFRSTLGHSTLELDRTDQSESGGPFLWMRQARSTTVDGTPFAWEGEHDGYRRLDPSVMHRRRVELAPDGTTVSIVDWVTGAGGHDARLVFHLGPTVECALDCGGGTGPARALLAWPGYDAGNGDGAPGEAPFEAVLDLAEGFRWTAHRGESDPPLGWYSPGFGRKVPSWTLVGTGRIEPPHAALISVLRFG